MRYGATRVAVKGIDYSWGSGEVLFEITVAHGKGTRDIDVAYPLEELVKLCDFMKQFGPEESGHGFWHYENKDRRFPCSSCVLLGKKVVKCREGGCAVHGTGEEEPCYVALDAPEGRKGHGQGSA